MVEQQRFLLITYPAQGHINPSLQLAKRLISMGAHVTFVTTVFMHRRVPALNSIPGLSLSVFSDGYDHGFNRSDDADVIFYMSLLKRRGSECLRNIMLSAQHRVTCMVYTLLLPWAAEVAREFQLPTALLWIQPAIVFDIYYYYFHGYGDYINHNLSLKHSRCSQQLPGLPFALERHDLPSFLLPSNTYTFALPSFKEQFQQLDTETNPTILVNTFQELEPEALRAVDKFTMIPIGPLIPSAFLDGKDPGDTSFGGDLYHASNDYVEWLNSKPNLSVVYVSFGSLAVLPKKQMEEIARGLLNFGHPFLWVIREKANKEEEELISCGEEVERVGKIVNWCSQLEVLSHPSLGCFMTHCGWNSTMESLVCGVPVVAFPQWTDQTTNAKLIQDVWKTGVRVDHHHRLDGEGGIVEAHEIRECLEVVMGSGQKAEELRRNAEKWKGLCREAVVEGGSSDKNLRAFLDDVGLSQSH